MHSRRVRCQVSERICRRLKGEYACALFCASVLTSAILRDNNILQIKREISSEISTWLTKYSDV